MKTTGSGKWCLVAVLLAVWGKAWGQEDGGTQTLQCMKAQTPQQCREALPACKAAYEGLVIGSAGAQPTPTQARLLHRWAWCEMQTGRYREAERLYRQGLAMHEKLLGSEHPDVGASLNNLASVLKAQGKYVEAERLFRQALAMRQKLLGVEHPAVAQSLNNLASVLDGQGKYVEAEGLYRQVLAMNQKLLGAEHPDVANSLNNLASVLENQGKYVEAERLHRQGLSMRQKLLGAEHPDVAQSLNNLASVLDDQGKYIEAERLFREALAMRQKLLGAEHPDVGASLNNLASVLDEQGKYGEAERLYREALAMRKKSLGAEHPAIATSLNNLAYVLDNQGKYGEAEGLYRQALAMRQKLLGAEHPAVATSFTNLASVLKAQGKYVEAERLYREALVLRQKLLGAEHPHVSQSLNNLASVLKVQGKYGEAERLYRQALAMLHKLLGMEHPSVAISLNNLASVLSDQGKYGEAERLYRQALAMRQKLLGMEHPAVANSLNNLAHVLDEQGKYGEAERLYRQALAMNQKLLGAEHPEVAGSLNNLASVLDAQGKYGEAEGLHRQALAMRQRLLGAEHPDVAYSLNSLAYVLDNQGKVGEAERLYRQALAMRQKLLGAEHPDVANSLNNLASVFKAQGKYGEAERLLRHGLAMRQKLLGAEHPDVANSLNNLALVLNAQGNYVEAERVNRQGLAMQQALLGAEHPAVATSLNNLAVVLLNTSAAEAAIPYLRQAAAIHETQLRATVSETRMQALLDRIRGEEDVIYGLLLQPNLRELPALALRTTLLRKGRVAESGALANRVVQASLGKPAVAARFAQWQGVLQQREALLYGGPGMLSGEDYAQRLGELKQQAESLEHQVVAELPELKQFQPPGMNEIIGQVAARLPADGVLVDVVRVKPWQAGVKDRSGRFGAAHYLAMLLFRDQKQVTVDLGEAAAIDPQVRALLEALSSPNGQAVAAAQAVYRQVLQPLVAQLGGRRNVYLSLDGTLSLIPFDALHDGEDYVLGRYRFHYLSSGRDLLRHPAERKASAAVVLGNPSFGNVSVTGAGKGEPSLYQRLAGLPALPGTQREVEQIAKRLGVVAQTHGAAREETVRSVHAPGILHIATHGLFLSDVELSASTDLDRGQGGVSPHPRQRSHRVPIAVAEQLPGELGAMNRSALVLADALQGQRAPDTTRDGLLTAAEARSLDLYGTQLVVLSACETGQGSLSAGQGVYGLRRAFLVAGAETLVISLWRVSDAATGDLMQRYYERLLDPSHPGDRLNALLETMQTLRGTPGRAHPYYWAPFLVIGQDGPLRLSAGG